MNRRSLTKVVINLQFTLPLTKQAPTPNGYALSILLPRPLATQPKRTRSRAFGRGYLSFSLLTRPPWSEATTPPAPVTLGSSPVT